MKLRFAGVSGTNPFTTHGPLLVDIRNGAFANNPALQLADFNAASSGPAGSVPNVLTNSWYSVDLDAAAFPFVNRTGTTQFRLRFQKDDNNDLGLDVLKLSSGNASANLRPILIVEYTIPPSP